jgi:catechol 2,3-dioxygenase-like lactoylglutathione lyase family enzyme
MARSVLVALALLIASPALAQLAAPNAAGVSMGHLHYQVQDIEANVRFWTSLGGVRAMAGDAVVLKFPDVLVFLTEGESSGGSDGSVVNHVAFRVPSFTTVEAAGQPVARLAQFPGVGSVMSPEGERIELFENAALNLTFTQDPGYQDPVAERHNRPLAAPVAFHHIHLYLPPGRVAEAKAWYVKMFGGTPGKRSTYEAVDLPGINLNLSDAPRPTSPTRGRRLDHIGFEIRGLEAFCRRLAAMGVIFDVPYGQDRAGGGRARFTDPWGTSIELTEGLGGV